MSDVFDPEPELIQDSVDAPSTDSFEAGDGNSKKKGLAGGLLSMDIYNVMLLLALIFIFLATLNMLGVLRTYNEGFPFSDGYPWSPNV